MRCLIVDDEEMSRKHLAHLCESSDDLELVSVCTDAIEALPYIKQDKIDLLFLDIEMPNLSGMELVKNIKDLPPVIFTTSHSDFALEAFEYNVIDYLVKPLSMARFIKAIEKAKTARKNNSVNTGDHDFFVRSEGKYVKISFDDILYIETMDDYLVVQLKNDKKHIIHSTLKGMEEKLDNQNFLKVHRSYIVNLSKVSTIESTHIEINKKIIPVSKAYRKVLLDKVKMI